LHCSAIVIKIISRLFHKFLKECFADAFRVLRDPAFAIICFPSRIPQLFLPCLKRENQQMSIKIYVGNLPYNMTQAELGDLFAQFGEIGSATIVTDKYSGRSRGFGFVEMTSRNEGEKAIGALDGKDIQGRKLKVSEALAKKEKGESGHRRSSGFRR
jgi:hypothetical protein